MSTGSSITTGVNNFFAGVGAGKNNSTGNSNNFLGFEAGYYNTGSHNNFFGSYAGQGNTGLYNNFFGQSAGYQNSGSNNNFLGYAAGYFNNGGNNNFIGNFAGYTNLNGTDNNFFGQQAGYYNNNGRYNNFFGYQAGYSNTSGANNIAIGQTAGYLNQTGSQNVVIGFNQQAPILNGSNQLVIGAGNTAWIYGNSSYNVGFGTTNPTTRISIAGTTGISFGDTNIRLGDADTGSSLVQTGDPNSPTASGRGFNNFFAGLSAGKVTTSGAHNNFIGWRAGYANTSGNSNNFIGWSAGYANTSGSSNNFIGAAAGVGNTTGGGNNFIGDSAGAYNTSGNYNTFVGSNAGLTNQTGNENVIIGYKQRNTPILNGSNQLVIGAGNTAWIYGNSSYNVGFGTTNPTAKVHIGAATTSDPGGSPLKIGAGTTILATPEVGAIEYDGSYLYQTPNSTSGRAYVPPVYSFRLTANGANIGATIADFFATPSSLSLEASSVYKIICFAYFTKTTAGTATWTHTFSSAPTIFTSSLTYSPVTGIANGTQTNVLSYSGGQATASMAHAATASLTTGVNHFSRFELIAVTNAATNWRLRLTQSAGTATPLAGSFYTIEKVGPSTGTFVA